MNIEKERNTKNLLITLFKDYVSLLQSELDTAVPFATACGWKSLEKNINSGFELRSAIERITKDAVRLEKEKLQAENERKIEQRKEIALALLASNMVIDTYQVVAICQEIHEFIYRELEDEDPLLTEPLDIAPK